MYPFDEKTYQVCGFFVVRELARMLARDRARQPRKNGVATRLVAAIRRGGTCVLLGFAEALIRVGNRLKEACYQPSHRIAD
jgi:hypothetical protein